MSEEDNNSEAPTSNGTKLNDENMDHESMDEKLAVNDTNNSVIKSKNNLSSLCAEINHVLLGQQMTCEILTNLCCDSDHDSESWEDDSDDASFSDMVR